MKKNFFKKLSFVLALAMIVSVIAPAAGVFAASKPKLNSSEKYLFLGQDGKEEYDFNISNKKTGWKYAWSSSNEGVASVNKKNGLVTAKKIGTTTVSVVIKNAKGAEVTELSAKVIVKDNIKSLAIKAPAAKFSTNTDYDFNRSYVTDNGSTSKTTSVTRWTVSGTATINDNGVFKATEAGKYTITARAFQSKAKYTEWLALNDATATKNVLATATYEVNVVASMTGVKQVDLDTFKVTFDTAMTDVANKISVTNMVGTTEVVNSIKEIKMSADNKEATVDLYTKFTEKSTYIVKYPEMDSVQFVAATSEVEDVKNIAITTTTAPIGESKELEIALYNTDGVNVADTDLLNRVTATSTTSNASYISGRRLTMYTLGDQTTVSVIFHTYKYDTTNGQEIGTLTASGVITCVDKEEDKPTNIVASTIKPAGKFDNFVSNIKNVAVGDQNYKLFVKLLVDKKNTTDTEYWNNNGTWNVGKTGFQMESSNNSVLIVDDYGNLHPVAVGTVSVIVKYKEVVVGAVNITVGARREVSVVSLDTYSFTLSNSSIVDEKIVTATVKDQFGEVLDASKYSISAVPVAETVVDSSKPVVVGQKQAAVGTDTPKKYFFQGYGAGVAAAEGTNVFKIVAIDDTSDKEVTVYVTVNVDTPADATVYSYKFDTDATTYDMKLDDTKSQVNVEFKLFGYANDGTKNAKYVVTGAGRTVEVLDPSGNTYSAVTSTDGGYTGVISLIGTTSGGSIVSKPKTGTWTIRAVSGSERIASTYFTVKDTQVAPVLTVDKTHVDLASTSDVLGAVNACVTTTLNGATITAVSQSDIEYSGVAGQYFINYVHYYESVAGGLKIDHKVAVNRTITIE